MSDDHHIQFSRDGAIARLRLALQTEAEALAAQLAALPPGGLAGLKRLLRASREAGLADQLDAERDSIARLLATATTMARLGAFLARG